MEPKPVTRIISQSSWLLKVLCALKALHKCTGSTGAKLEDIINHVKKTYGIEKGDTKSEIECAIDHAVRNNYVFKKNNKYVLVSPAASIHFLKPRDSKLDEIIRLQSIFPVSPTENQAEKSSDLKRKRSICDDSDSDDDASSSGSEKKTPCRKPRTRSEYCKKACKK